MTFEAIDAWWWPFVFILIAGWLATDSWRLLGVYFGGRVAEDSQVMVLVRCVATALVAAVIANLLIFPSGALAGTPTWLRVLAAGLGFVAYLASGRRILAGIAVAEAAFVVGWLFVT